MFVYLAV